MIVVGPNALVEDSELCRIIYLDSFFEKRNLFTEAMKMYECSIMQVFENRTPREKGDRKIVNYEHSFLPAASSPTNKYSRLWTLYPMLHLILSFELEYPLSQHVADRKQRAAKNIPSIHNPHDEIMLKKVVFRTGDKLR